MPDSIQAIYDRMHDAMVPLIQRHLVAIAAYSDGELRHHATGSLVRFSDRYFLVTAAHAIKDYVVGKEYYADLNLLIDNGHAQDLVPLYGSYHATDRVRDPERPRLRLGNESSDLWDIGLWELHPKTVEGLTNKRFLNRSDISVTEEMTSGVYFIAGSPCEWAHADSVSKNARWKWLRYISHPYPEADQLPHFDDRFHIALNWDDEAELPDRMQEISGCPIWKLASIPSEDWTVHDVRVVGVQTCVYSKKAICGTKWRWVLPVLTAMHPEIREGFKLWLPGNE